MKHNSTKTLGDELASACAEIDDILMCGPFASRSERETPADGNTDPAPSNDPGEGAPTHPDTGGRGGQPPGKRRGRSRGSDQVKSVPPPDENENPPKRPEAPPHDRLLRLREIIGPGGLIPVSRSAWWLGIKQGRYPHPVRVGLRAVAWRLSDLTRIVRDGVE